MKDSNEIKQETNLQWFMVSCDKCGWKWYESEQLHGKPFFYCPHCLSKVKNSYKKPKPKKLAGDKDLVNLKKFFDKKRLDNL